MRRVLTLLLLLPLAACEPGVLNPAGPVAAGDRTVLLNALAVMLAIIVPVIVLTLAFAWWFRAGNTRAKYRPDWSYSGQLELLVWSIPLLAVIFLSGIAWIGSHRLDPARPLPGKAIPVQVVSLDWKWLFIYPDQGVATINHLVVPAGRPIALRLTSATVMNSFAVPRLGSQLYAMSGMDAKLNLQADHPGRYRGWSAHYSGAGFADMTFAVDALPGGGFERWAAGAKGRGPALDAATYRKLALTEATARPATFGAVQPGLYDSVVANAGTTASRPLAHSGRVE
ncbi:ubiquinol oxidase subunit II [Sphingomonas bacterium]|uniref:ubiquinol oxidase subunit II n=1 Tax=Sphingomonas bacterium TaxID=1895847 RepID=UPI0020C5D5B1|nr:ubiquinol oxidase subunit II [Sphingomonas bacterium]